LVKCKGRLNSISIRNYNFLLQVISLEAPNAETEVILETPSRNTEYYVGLSWQLGLGKYKLSKVVTIAPRFIVRNSTSKPICFREVGSQPPENSVIQSGGRSSLILMRARDEKLLTVTYPGLNARWYEIVKPVCSILV
jgi:vacuolar protein sorting-associated protein 13A/C